MLAFPHPSLSGDFDAIDLFAGPGGWDVAAYDLGLRVLGIEWDKWAVATREAAGLPTIQGDVRAYGPGTEFFRTHVLGRIPGFIASPPCQTFSTAGGGSGRRALTTVLALLTEMEAREEIDLSVFDDERTALVLEPLRWILAAIDAGHPFSWIALEQVPTVLPVWEAVADVLSREGYSVAVGKLSAEQYGAPTTRVRAVLVARRGSEARLPEPTHRPYRRGVAQSEGDTVRLPWVSMRDAGVRGQEGKPYLRMDTQVSATVRHISEPFASITAGNATNEFGWTPSREHRDPRSVGGQIDLRDASVVQSFPPDYPWIGSRRCALLQIANAVPPLLARAILTSAIA